MCNIARSQTIGQPDIRKSLRAPDPGPVIIDHSRVPAPRVGLRAGESEVKDYFMPTAYGFSHVGVSTHQMDKTIEFYRTVLGFPPVVEDVTQVTSGGTVRMVYFDVGDNQFIVFMEPKNVPGIPADYDTSINGALGVPRGMYHFSFKVSTLEEL